MQTREQIKNWKVVASVATVAALGVSGLAVASPNEPADTPPPIEIQDQRQGNGFGPNTTTTLGFDVVGGPSFSPDDDDSLDSPLASAEFDSPDTTDSPAVDDLDTDDSPDTTSANTAPSSDDSPDTDSPDTSDSPDTDDSPDTEDSPDTDDSPDADDSPDTDDSPDDSPDSLDS